MKPKNIQMLNEGWSKITTRNLLTTLLSLVLINSSCNNLSDSDENILPDTQLKLDVHISNDGTRGLIESTTLPDGHSIGVTLVDADGETYDKISYNNIKATASTETASQTWRLDNEIMLSATDGTLYGYYPWSEDVTDITRIPVTAGDTDYMYATPVDKLNDSNNQASVTFNHALAAIRLNIVRGTYTGTGAVTAVSVKGDNIATSGLLNAKSGGLSSQSGMGTVITDKTAFTLSFTQIDYIFVPVTGKSAAPTFTVVVDGKDYTATPATTSFEQGNIYTYTLTLEAEELSFSVVKVSDWVYEESDNTFFNLGYDVNLKGDISSVALNTKVNDDGTLTIIAASLIEGCRVEEVSYEGTATVIQTVDEETGIRTIVISDIDSDINLTFDGVVTYETLTVAVDGIEDGYTVYVMSSDGNIIGTQTTATATYRVSQGTQYYVTASEVVGYESPSDSEKFTAIASGTRTLTMTYSIIKYETLTVAVSGLESDFLVTIKDTDGNILGTSTETTATFQIREGTDYTINATNVTGYNVSLSGTNFTAVGNESREVTVTYTLKTYTLTVNVTGLTSGFATTVKYGKNEEIQTTTSAIYTVAQGDTWNVAGVAMSGYEISGDESGTMTGDKTVTITYTKKTYTLTVEVTGLSSGFSTTVNYGNTTNEHTKTSATYTVAHGDTWSVAGGAVTGYNISGDESGTMTGDKTVTITYTKKTYTLTVNVTGLTSGFEVNVTYRNNVTIQTTTNATYTVAHGDTYSVTGKQASGYSSSGHMSGTMTGDRTVTIRCTPTTFYLTVYVTGLTRGFSATVKYGNTTRTQSTRSVIYTVKYGDTFSVTGSEVTGYKVVGNESGTITGDKTVTLTYTSDAVYTLTVNVIGLTSGFSADVICGSSSNIQTTTSATYTVAHGDTYDITPNRVTGYSVSSGFSGVMTGDKTLTITYTKKTYTLTVNVTGLSSGFSTTVNYGSTTNMQTITSATYTVAHGDTWSVAGGVVTGYNISGDESGTMTGNRTVTITYTKKTYTLTVNVTGLTSGFATTVKYGENEDIQTTTSAIYTVAHGDTWNVAGVAMSGYEISGDESGTMTGDKTVTITYTKKTYTLTVNVTGLSSGISTTVKYGNNTKTQTTASATYTVAHGDTYSVTGGAVTGYNVSGNTSGTMTGDKTVTITYTKKNYYLIVNITGLDNGCSATVKYGSTTQLQTAPSMRYAVKYGDTYSVTGGAVTGYNVSGDANGTITGDKTVTITYTKKTYTLTVNVTGLSSGFSTTVKYGSTTKTQTATSATYTVTHGDTYSVTGGTVTGYNVAGNTSGTMTANNSVTISYIKYYTASTAPNGVYAVFKSGSNLYLHAKDKMDANYFNYIGVGLIVNDAPTPQRLMIEKNGEINTTSIKAAYTADGATNTGDSNFYWGMYSSDISGITNYTSTGGGLTSANNSYLPDENGSYYAHSIYQISGDYTTWTSGVVSDFNGKANTAALQAASDTDSYTTYANMGTYCTKFNATSTENQGYTDWYIPAIGQLALMYMHMTSINTTLTKIGGTSLSDRTYWSSSEFSRDSAWYVSFGSGLIRWMQKYSIRQVRFVRDL